MEIEILGKTSCVLHTIEGSYLQSYKSIVAYRGQNGTIVYPKWDYSRTTAKHVAQWLGLSSNEIRKGIKEGRIKYESKEPEL